MPLGPLGMLVEKVYRAYSNSVPILDDSWIQKNIQKDIIYTNTLISHILPMRKWILFWYKDRHIHQWNKMRAQKSTSHTESVAFYKGDKRIQ